MNRTVIGKTLLISLFAAAICWTGCAAKSHTTEPDNETAQNNNLDTILENLTRAASDLQSYQCQIEYNFSQPLFDSQTLRKGNLYYKIAEKQSNLRINFDTIKHDDEKEDEQKEDFIFDGVWLTHINYQLKEIKKYQLTEVNEPADTFELVRKNFPIIGFGKNEDLKKEFEIKLIERQQNQSLFHLHLKVKPESVYKGDYTSIGFWIDGKAHLPVKIVAVNLEEDVYEMNLLKAKVNQELDDKVFDIKIPEGFGKPVIIPLKEKLK